MANLFENDNSDQEIKPDQLINSTNVVSEFKFSDVYKVIFRRRKIIGYATGLVFITTLFYTFYQRFYNPLYNGTFSLLISDPLNNKGRGTPSGIGQSLVMDIAKNRNVSDVPTLIEVLKSPVLLEDLARTYQKTTFSLINSIDIKVPKGQFNIAPGVLIIKVSDKNPSRLSSILQDLSKLYLKTSLKQRQQTLSDGLDFINQQAPELESKTEKLQELLANFREENNLIEPIKEGSSLKNKISDLKSQIRNMHVQRERLKEVRNKILEGTLSTRGFQQGIGTGPSSNQGLFVDDANQSLLKELTSLKIELAKARSNFLPSSKYIKSLESRLGQIKPTIKKKQLEAVDNALNLNQKRIDTANLEVEKLNKQFLIQPKLIKEYEYIIQRLDISKQNLASLVSARETFQLEIAQNAVPWSVIAPPTVNPLPSIPKIPNNLLLGGFISLLSGFLIGFAKDKKDNIFHDERELREDIDLPLVGTLPNLEFIFKDETPAGEENDIEKNMIQSLVNFDKNIPKTKEEIYQKFLYQESMRNIFTSIKFLGEEKGNKLIALTSSIPKEGKSLISILISKTFAELDKKVLTIDCDLRRPQLHKRLNLDNISGLTNLLTQKDVKFEDVIQKIDSIQNWDVLTTGPRPPDPTKLLSSKKFRNILKDLKDNNFYDYILIDTPPVLGLSDTLYVLNNVDTSLLISTISFVERSLPLNSKKIIEEMDTPSKGLIINAKNQNLGNKYQNYSYGYGGYSGYTYGEYSLSNVYSNYGKQKEFDLEPEVNEGNSKKNKIKNYVKNLKNVIKSIINKIND